MASGGGMPVHRVPVDWEVAEDDRFRTVVAKGQATARPELAHTVHVEVAGLKTQKGLPIRTAARWAVADGKAGLVAA